LTEATENLAKKRIKCKGKKRSQKRERRHGVQFTSRKNRKREFNLKDDTQGKGAFYQPRSKFEEISNHNELSGEGEKMHRTSEQKTKVVVKKKIR